MVKSGITTATLLAAVVQHGLSICLARHGTLLGIADKPTVMMHRCSTSWSVLLINVHVLPDRMKWEW